MVAWLTATLEALAEAIFESAVTYLVFAESLLGRQSLCRRYQNVFLWCSEREEKYTIRYNNMAYKFSSSLVHTDKAIVRAGALCPFVPSALFVLKEKGNGTKHAYLERLRRKQVHLAQQVFGR